MEHFFRDLKTYSGYAFYYAKAGLKADVANTYLGYLWWILEPLLSMAIYFFVFCILFHRPQLYAVAYIYMGLSCFRFFSGSLTESLSVVRHHKGIISRVYVPKFVFTISIIIRHMIKLLFSLLMVVPLIIYYSIPLTAYILELPVLLLLFAYFTFGICCVFTHLGVFAEDLTHFVKPMMRLLRYASGVFISIEGLLGSAKGALFISLNPLAFLLESIRDCTLYSTGCDWVMCLVWAMIGTSLMIFGVCAIYACENNYVKVV